MISGIFMIWLISSIGLMIEIAFIYIFMPLDVYHLSTRFSQHLLNLSLFLNDRFPLFPSFIIPLLEQQKILGAVRYLPNTVWLGIWLVVSVMARKPSRLSYGFLLLSNLVVYLETVTNLVQHRLDQALISPLLLLVWLVWYRLIKLKNPPYLSLLGILSLYLISSLIQPLLENFIYNRLQLFFIPLVWFNHLPGWLVITIPAVLIWPLFKSRISAQWAFRIWIGLYVIVNLLGSVSLSEFGHSRWIWTHTHSLDQYVKFRKNFYLIPFVPVTAQVKITAKSSYQLFINQVLVGQGPGPIDEAKRFFDVYQLTPYLKPGNNRIEILSYNYDHATHFQKQQIAGVLANFEFKIAGMRLNLPTNRTWLVTEHTGWQKIDLTHVGVKDYEINSGLYREVYDFSDIQPEYYLATETDISPKDHLIKRDIPPLAYSIRNPQSKFFKDGSLWMDFTQVLAGYPRLTFDTSGPTTVTVRYLENWASSMVQEDKFILPKKGRFSQRTFGRRGLRIAKLTWEPDVQLAADLEVITVNFPADEVGQFQSGEEIYNRIYDLGKNTLKYALQDQFEDSFIHERSQYLGDAYVDMLMGFYSLDSSLLAKKALFQFASTQKPSGLIETVYPSGLYQTILSYNLLFISLLKDYYLYTQDLPTLTQLLPTAEKIVAAFSNLQNQIGLIDPDQPTQLEFGEILTTWIDHVSISDPSPDTKLSLTALYAKALSDLQNLYQEIDPPKSQKYQQQKQVLVKRLEHYLRSQKLTQLEPHAATLLLFSQTLDPEIAERIYEQALKNISPTFITGYFNLFYLQVMAQFGDPQDVKNLLTSYWADMLARGAVSTWETFDPRTSQTYATSQTHAWSGGPTYFLPAYVAGLRPAAPGFTTLLVEPLLITHQVSTRNRFACGEIAVAWKKQPHSFSLDLQKTCPGNVLVRLPFSPDQVKSFRISQVLTKPQYSGKFLIYQTAAPEVILEVKL